MALNIKTNTGFPMHSGNRYFQFKLNRLLRKVIEKIQSFHNGRACLCICVPRLALGQWEGCMSGEIISIPWVGAYTGCGH